MVTEPRYYRDPPTKQEMMKMVKIILGSDCYLPNRAGDYLRIRDSTLILLGMHVGLRPLELLNLKWSDIDYKRNLIYINGFNNKERTYEPAIMCKKAKIIILSYKKASSQYINSEFMFPSLFTLQPISSGCLAKIFRKIAKQAKVHRIIWYTQCGQPISNYTPYSMRKYYGNTVYNKTGSDLKALRALRNHHHDSLRPYARPDVNRLKQEIDKFM